MSVALLVIAPLASAQVQPQRDSTVHRMPVAGDTMSMPTGPLGIPMDRMASGTTWIPDAASVPSRHRMLGGWELMLHGFVFAQYIDQGGSRGDVQFGSLNWGMVMASRGLAGGRLQARTMLSLDPATVTNRGYPMLLQTGETADGERLHDRQHPHDFFKELGVLYERPISERLAFLLYAAPSGEPALGPVAFMHRPSAMDNPFAPLGHHWQDATHISFGVVTGGVFTRTWKLEGSIFNGREPNEERWDFDRIKLDSYSGRLTVNPTSNWSFSAGYGYLDSPEALSPDESIHRFTAAALHGVTLGTDGQLASAVVYGSNKSSHDASRSFSALLESEAILDRWNTILLRAERAQKTAEDLGLDDDPAALFPSGRRFDVSSLSLGYIRELGRSRGATVGVGAIGTVNMVPLALENTYGSRTPSGWTIFLRLRPFHTRAMTGMPGMRHDHTP